MPTSAPISFPKFKSDFLANFLAGRTTVELFKMLSSRMEYLQNLPTNLSNVPHQMKELQILSYIQPWALESRDNFFVFEEAVSLIPANTQVDYFTKLESLDACLSFIQEIQQPPAVAASKPSESVVSDVMGLRREVAEPKAHHRVAAFDALTEEDDDYFRRPPFDIQKELGRAVQFINKVGERPARVVLVVYSIDPALKTRLLDCTRHHHVTGYVKRVDDFTAVVCEGRGTAIFQVIQHLLHYRVKLEYKLLDRRFLTFRTQFTIHKSQGKLLVREDSFGHNPPDDQSDKSISSMPSYFYGRC